MKKKEKKQSEEVNPRRNDTNNPISYYKIKYEAQIKSDPKNNFGAAE